MSELVAAVSMVKNEQDIIEYTVSNMLNQVDFVVVADNMSTDNTRDILESLAEQYNNLIIVDDLDPAYEQSRKMTALAYQAGGMGAEWAIPFDADEYWQTTMPAQFIKDVIVKTRYDIYVAPIYNYVPTAKDDLGIVSPCRRLRYRLAAVGELKKVAVRIRPGLTIAMGNHSADYIDHMPTYNVNDLEVRHFPWRTKEQFVNKALQGAVSLGLANLDYSQGEHWRRYAEIAHNNGIEALEEVFIEHFWRNDVDNDIVYDPI